MNTSYIPYYRSTVRESTYKVRVKSLEKMRDRFSSVVMRSFSLEDIQNYRIWLLTDEDKGGAGYSQAYASLVFGMFRKSLDYAVEMGYMEYNISKKSKAIPKGKANIEYWTKSEFEQVISQIYIADFYEHLNFVMLWIYFMTGIRVNEGAALWWNDIDFHNKKMRVHYMLEILNKKNWKRNPYTKTDSGKRIISLDDDTISILREWKQRQMSIGLGNENDFVFSYDSLPVIKSTIARVIARYSKLAKVKKIQAKGLRHSHASYIINEINASVLVLSHRLGHSSPEITLKHYSHMWSGADETITEKMKGNIKIQTADSKQFRFTGNQAVPNDIEKTDGRHRVHQRTLETVVS